MTPSSSLPVAAPQAAVPADAVSSADLRLEVAADAAPGSFDDCCERAALPASRQPSSAQTEPTPSADGAANEPAAAPTPVESATSDDETTHEPIAATGIVVVSPVHARSAPVEVIVATSPSISTDMPLEGESTEQTEQVVSQSTRSVPLPSRPPGIAVARAPVANASPSASTPLPASGAEEAPPSAPTATTAASLPAPATIPTPTRTANAGVQTPTAVGSTPAALRVVSEATSTVAQEANTAAGAAPVSPRISGPAEKTSPPVVRNATRAVVKEDSDFLKPDSEGVTAPKADAGTGVALHAGDMKSAPFLHQRFGAHPGERANPQAAGSEGEAEAVSVTWKGWTNGGGERASTAAQFSRLGEHSPAQHGPFFTPPGFGTGRVGGTATVTMASTPATSAFTLSETDATAPVSAAIERLIARGQDHLSVTVRFEQGGSLSLKLALREGEIVSQFQTDVPGLENALRSAWGQFSNDWQGRGWKLASPSFSSGTASQQDLANSGRDGRPADREQANADPAFGAPAPSTTSASRMRPTGVRNTREATNAAAARTATGLTTWA